jgi:uncharacterized protein YcbX
MLTDQAGKFVSQREYPQLALLSVAFTADGLSVSGPDRPPLLIPFHLHASQSVLVAIWNDETEAYPVDDVANIWFSDYIGESLSLVVMPDHTHRPIRHSYFPGDTVSFADGYPMLLIGESSLDDLNSRLDIPLPMNRFRPNLVTRGNEAYSEDNWAEIKIGNEHVHGVSNCSRCAMTTINQETAERGVEPIKTLAEYRNVGKKVIFGRNLIPADIGWIHVGDEVEIVSFDAADASENEF